MENLDLLRFFFHADSAVSNSTNSRNSNDPTSSSSSPSGGPDSSNFLVFSLLVGFLHRDGHVGQQARDALINVMAMSRKNEDVGNYIAKHSNFCPVSALDKVVRYVQGDHSFCTLGVVDLKTKVAV